MSEIQQELKIHIAHFGPMDQQLAQELQDLDQISTTLDEGPSTVPILEEPSKGDLNTMAPLAWLVITLVATGGAIFMKAFLEELGKKSAEKIFNSVGHEGDVAENVPPSELARPDGVEWHPLPQYELAIVLRASDYVYAVTEFYPEDLQSVRSKDGWAQMVDEVTQLIRKVVDVHEAYHELWPELQPDPVVIEIQREGGKWMIANHLAGMTPPHPPSRLERTRFHRLFFAEDLKAARAQASQSLRNARSVDKEEGRRRYEEMNRRFPPGYL